MSTLWTFGCSFTAEYYPVGCPNMPSKYDEYKKWRNNNLPDVWPTLLANKLGYECQNRAVGGSSNYLIFKQFLDFVHSVKKDDILIFGWTNSARFQLVNEEENVFNQIQPNSVGGFPGISVSQNAINEVLINRTHNLWIEEVFSWMLLINIYLNKIGAHVFHWTSDEHITIQFKNLFKDDYRIIKGNDYENINRCIMSEIEDLCNEQHDRLIAKISQETNETVDDGHFGEYGHITQSEYMYNYIKEFL